MKEVVIRKAVQADMNAISAIIKESLELYDLPFSLNGSDEDLVDIEKSYFSNNGWLYVLIYRNEVIGSCGIMKIDSKVCELKKLYLREKCQGLGFGKLLLEHTIQKAIELGYEEMALESNSCLQKAHRLYEKYGFTNMNAVIGSSRCDYAMQRKLLSKCNKNFKLRHYRKYGKS